MFHYLFVWDQQEHKAIERYWIIDPQNRFTTPPEFKELKIISNLEESEKKIEELRLQYREPRYLVARMFATNWAAVEENYPGLG